MPKRSLLVGLILALGCSTAWGFAPVDQRASFEVPLPQEMIAPVYQQLSQAEAKQALPGWDAFLAERGTTWVVGQYRTALGAPAAIFGPGFSLVPAGADDATAGDIARKFALDHAGLLKADRAQLGQPEVIRYDDFTTILLGQTYQGLEVMGGRIELDLKDGLLVLFGSEFYPNIRVSTVPALDRQQAEAAAISGMPFNPVTDQFSTPARLVVYPIILNQTPSYYLAYEVRMSSVNPPGDWWIYVDASDGQILSRINDVATYDIPVTVKADAQLEFSTDPMTEVTSPYAYARANSTNYYADANGFVNLTVPDTVNYTVTSEIRGRYANANRQDGADATFSGSGKQGVPLTIKWDATNSDVAERDVYYSMNRVHAWIKSVDPTFLDMDYAVVGNVNINNTCNAYWSPTNLNLNFYQAGGGCVNTATISDVVMHEYGHGITQYTYSPSGAPTSSGMGEALSDIIAQTITNNVLLGAGFNGPGTYVRDGNNSRQYPGTECAGEVHCLGEILMGSMWHTRVNFLNTYGYTAGKTKYDKLFRTAHKTKQIDMPSFLWRLQLADDNNANLADGTPNWNEICEAFQAHNLPCANVTQYITFTHSPLSDAYGTDPAASYPVKSLIQPVNCGTLVADSVRVFYSINGGSSWSWVRMNATGNPSEYLGAIPAQPCGTVVTYYLRARTSTNTANTLPGYAPIHGDYSFLVGGIVPVVNDDCETDTGWTRDTGGDTATQGFWERVDPQGKTNPTSGQTVQPEDDHTPAPGVTCWVTDGRAGTSWSSYNVGGGATSIISPLFDFTPGAGGAARVDFWGFFYDFSPVDDTLRACVSNDGGTTWFDILKIYGDDKNAWKEYSGTFTDAQVPFTNQMRFRFKIADTNTSVCEGAIDDIYIGYMDCRAESGVTDGAGTLPLSFQVERARPNPVQGSTVIRFSLPATSRVLAEIFDVSGRMVRRLADKQMDAGIQSVSWNGRDDQGKSLPAGMYFYRVRAGEQEQTHRMMLVK